MIESNVILAMKDFVAINAYQSRNFVFVEMVRWYILIHHSIIAVILILVMLINKITPIAKVLYKIENLHAREHVSKHQLLDGTVDFVKINRNVTWKYCPVMECQDVMSKCILIMEYPLSVKINVPQYYII